MKITIIQISKTKHRFFQEAEQEYLKRLQAFAKIEVITIKESVANQGSASESGRLSAKTKEGQEILKQIQTKRLPENSFIIALTEKGQSLNSVKFAEFLKQKIDFGPGHITFIIGGPFGLSDEVLKAAHYQLSFSAFTFTHEMIRVLLMEQLYRACTIMKGKTYHY